MEKQIRLYIGGMTCVNCQNKIEKKLNSTDGILRAHVSYKRGQADIVWDTEKISLGDITSVIEKLDYTVQKSPPKQAADITRIICMPAIIIALYVLLQSMGILNLLVPSQLAETKMGYGMLFVIGLITSVHCIAMCGGINLSQCIAPGGPTGTNTGKFSAFRPAFLYNLGRVASYTAIGFILGLAGMIIGGGARIGGNILLQGIVKIAAGICMVIAGVNMLNLFPALRRLTIGMPRFFARKADSKKEKNNRPFYVGILNGFMPCGPLQSMWIVALASGSPWSGALSMFLFSLGTVPLMLGLGSVVSALGKKFRDTVMTVGAILVVVLGLAMLSQGGALTGWFSPDVLSVGEAPKEDTSVQLTDGVQVIRSTLEPGSYPDITVQAGIPVKWIIDAPKGSINGCNYKMFIRDLGVEHEFQTGENVIEFTVEDACTIRYSCWMGMIHGNIFVTNGGN